MNVKRENEVRFFSFCFLLIEQKLAVQREKPNDKRARNKEKKG